VWHVPESIHDFVFEQTGRVLPESMPPGPENPLGKYAIYLTLSGYLIHGTNQPWSVGKLISSGCIRLHNADMAELYPLAKIGDPVYIIHHPYKAGWKDGTLFLEAHVPVTIDDKLGKLNILSINQTMKAYLKDNRYQIDWHLVDRIIKHPNGIPNAVGTRS
ncbi:MAG: L,D-transpeptidase family protein, partial [Candidatus Caenarcaniphilales bacterium]|nr:L,D-transpeptidase family protein [Candidatus Caenarcaniphilales bacterium]